MNESSLQFDMTECLMFSFRVFFFLLFHSHSHSHSQQILFCSRRRISYWHNTLNENNNIKKNIIWHDIWTGRISENYGPQVCWKENQSNKKGKKSVIVLSPLFALHVVYEHQKHIGPIFDSPFSIFHFNSVQCTCYLENVRYVYSSFRNKSDKNYWWLPIFELAVGNNDKKLKVSGSSKCAK